MESSTPHSLFLLLLLLIFLLFFTHFSSAASLDDSLLSTLLLTFKGGNSSWNTSSPSPCHWNGIHCNENGDVTNVSLSGLRLSGFLPDNISLLQSSLRRVDLSNNSLQGTIPAGLTQLSNLEYLDLSLNNLQGSIPADIGNLTNISLFAVSQNNLTGHIPDSITRLSKLKTLSAYQNRLEGPIPSMNSSNLVSVNLASNDLTGEIPNGLCLSGSLTVLLLTNNRLTGSIPQDLASCVSLTTLRVGQNGLGGAIDENFGGLENLVYLEADQNQLSGGLPSNIDWKNLSLLNLANNLLNGTIPDSLSHATALQEIRLSNNAFSGPIPKYLSRFPNLSVIDLSMNQLSDVVPANICSIHRLEHLRLGGNSLSGSIPSSIGECSNLLELDLGQNRLSGSIPTQVGSLSNLQVSLNLSWNQLTGNIPKELGSLGKLVSLDLSHNGLSGEIPVDLSGMVSLLDVDFSYNQLTGSIPSIKNANNASKFSHNLGLCGPPLSMACPTDMAPNPKTESTNLSVWKIAGIVLGCGALVILIISAIAMCLMRKHYLHQVVDPLPGVVARRIFSDEVEKAIDFDSIKAVSGTTSNIISMNRFSVVYKAVMPSGFVVAVKKLISGERSIAIHQRKMISELDKLMKLSHVNIMQPVGYYIENELALIIYDFVPACSLQQKLHRPPEDLFSWSSRYRVAVRAAQGLAFLHHACTPAVTHIDVSSSNIFLGANMEVKIGDVEVAKLLDPSKHTGSISAVAGTFGYIPPEYAFTMRVTLASNVYSFGVVLLELLTGRKPVDESFGDGLDLVKWVHNASSRGEMPEQILDARISSQSQYISQEMLAVLRIALLCTHNSPMKRPRMKKVLQMIQDVKLQTYSYES